MSRSWTKEDELYIIKENISTLNADIEYLVHRIKATIEFPIILENIMVAYKEKIETIEHFYDKDFIFRNSILEYFNLIIKDSIRELVKCINKLDNPLYNKLLNCKIILLLIDINIKRYNDNIKMIKNFNVKDHIDELLYLRYRDKKDIYTTEEMKIIKEKDTTYINSIMII